MIFIKYSLIRLLYLFLFLLTVQFIVYRNFSSFITRFLNVSLKIYQFPNNKIKYLPA